MPLTALRSEWLRSMPVSMTATATLAAECAAVVVAPPMRRMPVGAFSPAASASASIEAIPSGSTASTNGRRATAAATAGLSRAAKPFSAAP